ncbi:MAG: hypothetical protein C4530_19750 [Desulfobacteraceae bacterium]|nr:MAG: hypothetical protein C4530_19750 [Desulfobacteraceae bacterium]
MKKFTITVDFPRSGIELVFKIQASGTNHPFPSKLANDSMKTFNRNTSKIIWMDMSLLFQP